MDHPPVGDGGPPTRLTPPGRAGPWRPSADLHPLWSGPRPYEEGFPHTVTVHAFRGATDAGQEDVVCGEGRAMVFVPGDEVLDRDLAVSSALLLPLHLTAAPGAG
ncbi:hypothetical protein B0E53_00543 [Micromonospora sp. MH33]|nr:hypothetical protein B0E53_00543 [Micromonospora sp. MH33]